MSAERGRLVRRLLLRTTACVCLAPVAAPAHAPDSRQDLVLSCDSTFAPGLDIRRLEERFGAANVSAARVDIGEGRTVSGTVLFATDSTRRVEALNRGPFRLDGFGHDGGGLVRSWSGGSLDAGASAPCTMEARFAPAEGDITPGRAAFRQVTGERPFSSGHPAMQDLNPVVVELRLVFH